MTNTLRPGLPPLPEKMRQLPIDKRGFPVPYFVAIVNGEPDHRLVEPLAVKKCVEQRRCWICGEPLGVYKSFTVGPMCAVNRISSEPPAHLDCARYSVQACPFLSRPHAHRRDAGLPDDIRDPAGGFLQRNPGVSLIWTTRTYKPYRASRASGGTGLLYDMGPAESMEWYAEGRPATRPEVEASITSGVPALVDAAQGDPAGLLELGARTAELMQRVARQFED